jgi:16S rRNA G527 N7-methylase RsmG
VKTALLAAWWRLFLLLAVKHVRTLRTASEQVAIDADAVLARTFARMASMRRFAQAFPARGGCEPADATSR